MMNNITSAYTTTASAVSNSSSSSNSNSNSNISNSNSSSKILSDVKSDGFVYSDYFPNPSNKKLSIIHRSLSVSTNIKKASLISKAIFKWVYTINSVATSELTITDCFASIGVNSINFLNYFHRVNALETDVECYEALKNNVQYYDINKNVQVYNELIYNSSCINDTVVYINISAITESQKKQIYRDMWNIFSEDKSWISMLVNFLTNSKSKIIVLRIDNSVSISTLIKDIFSVDIRVLKFCHFNLIGIFHNTRIE